MRYYSTRASDQAASASFSDVLLEGLAPDGGLYVPEHYPRLTPDHLDRWRGVLNEQGYAALAAAVVGLFADDIEPTALKQLCESAYTADLFGGPSIVPVTELSGGMRLVHLSNGPTAAFKDLAMQLLGQLFEYELERRGLRLNILGATSGDTGSAAEYAMIGKQSIRVFMLTPRGRMSPFQQAQMFSIDDPHIVNISVPGVFDDCQDLVKEVFSDAEFRQRYSLGAVNSINIARVLAQVVYYVAAWLRSTEHAGDKVSFAVPTGNFGNILAGHVAREMGLPISNLILATNENNVLAEFFDTGKYRIRPAADTWQTSSPSMDISKASNFERFVFDLVGRDSERVRTLFGEELRTRGEFDLSGTDEFKSLRARYGIVAGTSRHVDRVATIRSVYENDAVLIDPHTADGVFVARPLVAAEPMLVMETALPVKFAATMVEAVGFEPEPPIRFAGIEDLPRHVVDLDGGADELKALISARAQ